MRLQNRGLTDLYCRQQGIWPREVFGYDPQAERERFIPYCPERNVDANFPPTLLIHGDADTDVPYELSVRMATVLREHGVEHDLMTISGGDHAFDFPTGPAGPALHGPPPAGSGVYMKKVLDFLARHLG